MTQRTRGMIILLAAALFAAPTVADTSTDDAGDTADTAINLPDSGAYSGHLDVGDVDWYRLKAPTASGLKDSHVCTRATATSSITGSVRLTTDPLEADTLDGLLTSSTTRFGLAGWIAGDDVYLRVKDILSDSDTETSGIGTYDFSIETTTFGDLGAADAGTGTDAGSTREAALPPVHPCGTGKLDPKDDALDVYVFESDGEDALMLSLTSVDAIPVSATIVNPAGDAVALVSLDEASAFTLGTAGTWSLELSTTSDSPLQYVLGFTLNDDPTSSPCRPNCELV